MARRSSNAIQGTTCPRQRLAAGEARAEVDPARCDEVVRRFVAACAGGDLDAFLGLLTSDAVLVFDGGPEVRTAARHPLRGAERVARFLRHVMSRLPACGHVVPTTLNGGPAVLVSAGQVSSSGRCSSSRARTAPASSAGCATRRSSSD
jgi:RNA polymerase sigma-70 factor (ECF subfamily)